jgi:hypothetical protein
MTFLEIRENILDYIDEWKLNPDNWLFMFLKDTMFEITLSHQGYLYLSYLFLLSLFSSYSITSCSLTIPCKSCHAYPE